MEQLVAAPSAIRGAVSLNSLSQISLATEEDLALERQLSLVHLSAKGQDGEYHMH